MPPLPIGREFAFLLKDVSRMLRTYADYEAGKFGTTQAQWAVLSRLKLNEGLKQNELAEMLDIQPITLTRLVDRMCESGLIERRNDPADRRAKRLYLTPAAEPMIQRLSSLGEKVMDDVLDGFSREDIEKMVGQFAALKQNLRKLLQRKCTEAAKEGGLERHYG